MSSCFSFSFAILNFGIKRTQNMYGIVVETLRLSLIYLHCFRGISFRGVTDSQCQALRKVNEKEIRVFSGEMGLDLTLVLSQ